MNQRKQANGQRVSSKGAKMLDFPMRLHDLSVPKSNPINDNIMYRVTTGGLAAAFFIWLNIPNAEEWKLILAVLGGVTMVIANSGGKIIEVVGKWQDRRHTNRMNKLAEKEEQLRIKNIEEDYDRKSL